MTTIAVCDPRPCAFGFLRGDKRVYNFITEGWDLLSSPAGASAADLRVVHYHPMERFSPDPRLSNVQHAEVPPIVSSIGGAWMVIYRMGDDGKVIEAIDVWPPPWETKAGVKGGVSG